MRFHLPYDKTQVPVEIDDQNFVGSLISRVEARRCSEFINSPNTRPGILEDNPIHQDMLYAAKTVGLKFIVNVILNSERKISAAFSGGLEEAHAQGCQFLTSLARVNKVDCDVTVVSKPFTSKMVEQLAPFL